MIKYKKPRIKFFGLELVNHTYQRKFNIRRPFRFDKYSEKKLNENSFELGKVPKVILESLLKGAGLGVGLALTGLGLVRLGAYLGNQKK